MIISVNWLKKFTDIHNSVEELVELIGTRLVEIESVQDLGEKYKDVVVAKVVEVYSLEGSDHLHVVKIDDGNKVQGVERDAHGLVQVVCGAPNVREGLLVAWLPPKSIVPETFHDAEPFVLSAKLLRGVMSNGMLASAKELDLYDDHTGILEIDKDAAPGRSFAELYELDDYLLDIENKSLTHRPDAFGVIGFAREVAGIQGVPFSTPEWLAQLDVVIQGDNSLTPPDINIDDPALSDRFQAIVLSNVNETARSPIQLQTYLSRSGVRPISAAVDISNYLMLLTGQPSHTYDYDKLKAIAGNDFTLRVRNAQEGEQLTLLDGKTITLDASDIVIAAGSTAVGLAGIMGGNSTAVDENTKHVILEVATFDLYSMRSSQMRHGIFSEAVTRFTKGIPAPLSAPVLAEAVRMLTETTGAQVSSSIVEAYPGQSKAISVPITVEAVNNVLGTYFSAEDIKELLQNVGFGVAFNGLDGVVTVPYWRQDIHIPEDVVEEVGRLTGYDTIDITLPVRQFKAVLPSKFDTLRTAIRTSLVRTGANEVLTYSFVHGDIFKKVGQSPDNAYRIVNSISPELQYYRQSLTPSLLAHVHQNVKSGYGSFALFEVNKVHQKSDGLTDDNVPMEQHNIAYVITDAKTHGDAYYAAKHVLEHILQLQGIRIVLRPLQQKGGAMDTPFEPKRSAVVLHEDTGVYLGVVGEFTQAVRRAFKLPEYTAGFELDMQAVSQAALTAQVSYTPLGRYPGTERDVCFQVSTETLYETVVASANKALQATALQTSIEPVDIYQPESGDTKNVTIRIRLASYEKTLTSDEIARVITSVEQLVTAETNGKVL